MEPLFQLRRGLHRQLDPEAWDGWGLSPLNWTMFAAIWLSILFGIFATEPAFVSLLDGKLAMIDRAILGFFAIEYVGRLATAGLNPKYSGFEGLLKYAAQPASIADLIVIAPIFLTAPPTWMLIFRLLRILRLLRLATLPNVHRAIDEFGAALAVKRFELTLASVIGAVLILISSTTLYLIERNLQPDAFGSIPKAMWWSVVTLTTLGYGDVTPVSPAGRFFAGVFAILGLGLIAMFTGVIASALSDAADRHTRNKTKRKKNNERG